MNWTKLAQEEYDRLADKPLPLMNSVELHEVVMILYRKYGASYHGTAEDWFKSILTERFNDLVRLQEDQMEERNGEEP